MNSFAISIFASNPRVVKGSCILIKNKSSRRTRVVDEQTSLVIRMGTCRIVQIVLWMLVCILIWLIQRSLLHTIDLARLIGSLLACKIVSLGVLLPPLLLGLIQTNYFILLFSIVKNARFPLSPQLHRLLVFFLHSLPSSLVHLKPFVSENLGLYWITVFLRFYSIYHGRLVYMVAYFERCTLF